MRWPVLLASLLLRAAQGWRYQCELCACGFDKQKSHAAHLAGRRHAGSLENEPIVWRDWQASGAAWFSAAVSRVEATRAWSLDRFVDGLPARTRSSTGRTLGGGGHGSGGDGEAGQLDPGLMLSDLPANKRAALFRYCRDLSDRVGRGPAPPQLALPTMLSMLDPRFCRVKEILESCEAYAHAAKLLSRRRVSVVLDVGCGHGLVGMLCAAAMPEVRVIALDIAPRASFAAQREAFEQSGTRLDNLFFVRGGLEKVQEGLNIAPRDSLVTQCEAFEQSATVMDNLRFVRGEWERVQEGLAVGTTEHMVDADGSEGVEVAGASGAIGEEATESKVDVNGHECVRLAGASGATGNQAGHEFVNVAGGQAVVGIGAGERMLTVHHTAPPRRQTSKPAYFAGYQAGRVPVSLAGHRNPMAGANGATSDQAGRDPVSLAGEQAGREFVPLGRSQVGLEHVALALAGHRDVLLLCVHGCNQLTPDAIQLANDNGWAWMAMPCCLQSAAHLGPAFLSLQSAPHLGPASNGPAANRPAGSRPAVNRPALNRLAGNRPAMIRPAILSLPDRTRHAVLCGALAAQSGAESILNIDPRITARGLVLASAGGGDATGDAAV
jgi:hypothetical protein